MQNVLYATGGLSRSYMLYEIVKRSNRSGITLEYYGQILASSLGIFMNVWSVMGKQQIHTELASLLGV